MRVALEKVEGVQSVTVSLKQGRASLLLKPGNSVELSKLRTLVDEQGFTPREARVTVVGDLVRFEGKLRFKVGAANEAFEVAAPPHQWQERLGKNLVVKGLISVPGPDKTPSTLQILEIAPGPPSKQPAP